MTELKRNPAGWPEDIYIVKSVERDDLYTYITTDDNSGFGIANKHLTIIPEPGYEVVRYGGLGWTTKGVVINGQVQFYMTREEDEAERAEYNAYYDRRQQREFEEKIADWSARADALPAPYMYRIKRFVLKHGFEEFWRDDRGYELFILEQAAIMEKWARDKDKDNPVQALSDWNDLNSEKHGYDYKAQAAAMPGYDEGHSGNTHAAAVMLARSVLEGKEI